MFNDLTVLEAVFLVWAAGCLFFALRYKVFLNQYLKSIVKKYNLKKELEKDVVDNLKELLNSAPLKSQVKWIFLWFVPGYKPKIRLDFYDNNYPS